MHYLRQLIHALPGLVGWGGGGCEGQFSKKLKSTRRMEEEKRKKSKTTREKRGMKEKKAAKRARVRD